jgi:molecular chaperone GrpE
MSEQSPPIVFEGIAVDPGSKLTHDSIDQILQDFRSWLEQAAQCASNGEARAAAEPDFSWQTLVAEFTALRQEVNLQTRASRAQLEQNAVMLQQLEEQTQALEEAQTTVGVHEPGDEVLRPLLKTFVEVYDALALARREVQRMQLAIDKMATEAATTPIQSYWWPWRRNQVENSKISPNITEQFRQVFNSVLVGYHMSLERIKRALAQNEMEPIACVGQPFDPETMEVVDVVVESGHQGTQVVEEVRPGYRWRGRLFRASQVRVSRGER